MAFLVLYERYKSADEHTHRINEFAVVDKLDMEMRRSSAFDVGSFAHCAHNITAVYLVSLFYSKIRAKSAVFRGITVQVVDRHGNSPQGIV